MPAVSKAQQRFFGVVRSLQKGDFPKSKATKDVKDAAKTMTRKDVKDYAKTKHTNLPEKVKKESLTSRQKFQLVCESVDAYNQLFYKKLEKYGVHSPEQLTEEEKKRFFSELDGEWTSTQEDCGEKH